MPAGAVAETESLSFEQALKELESIVRRLEGGSGALDEAINDYVRGTALERHCRKQLEAARLKIELITKGEDGTSSTQPFEQ